MSESSDRYEGIPKNTMKRLEEALQTDEKGGEAALFTQTYNLFDGFEDCCQHRVEDLESEERGELFVIRQSSIVDEIIDGNGTKNDVTLTYVRTFNIDVDGNEVLDLESQRICYEEIAGDVRAVVELPDYLSVAEADFDKIDVLIRRHIDEIRPNS